MPGTSATTQRCRSAHRVQSRPPLPLPAKTTRRATAPAAACTSAVIWGPSTIAGRGLFAATAYAAGETIVCSPALAVKAGSLDPIVSPYAFVIRGEDAPAAHRYALVFGPVSLCNHADAPNASVTFEQVDGAGLQARLSALRPISDGEEIFIRYPDRTRYHGPGWK